MTKRETAFLLIGLGIGLVFTVLVVVELVLAFQHMFIMGFRWRPGTILMTLPFLPIFIGGLMLRRSKTT